MSLLSSRSGRLVVALAALLVIGLAAGSFALALLLRPTTAALDLRDGTKEVALNRPLTLSFTRPVEPAAVEAALRVEPVVQGSLDADGAHRVFRFRPVGPWADLTTYTVTLQPLKDAAGRAVAGERWRFTTTIVPRVTGVATETGASADDGASVPLGSQLNVIFNTAMLESSVSLLANGAPAALTWTVDGLKAAFSTKGVSAGGLDLALGSGGKDRLGHSLLPGWSLHLDLVFAVSEHTTKLATPALVQIPNDNYGARDQSGIQAANIAFEYQTEGGITRITALFTAIPDVVGPIRSGRLISFKLTRHYRGVNYFSGLSSGSFAVLNSNPVPTMFENNTYYYRSSDRVAPNNLYMRGPSIAGYAPSLGVPAYSLPTSGAPVFTGGTPAPSVSDAETHSDYAYDPATGTYTKAEDGHLMNDALIGQPLHIQLLVVLHTREFVTSIVEDVGGGHGRDFDLESGGRAEFYYRGMEATGKWSAADARSPFVFTLDSGQALTLPNSLVWVDVVS